MNYLFIYYYNPKQLLWLGYLGEELKTSLRFVNPDLPQVLEITTATANECSLSPRELSNLYLAPPSGVNPGSAAVESALSPRWKLGDIRAELEAGHTLLAKARLEYPIKINAEIML